MMRKELAVVKFKAISNTWDLGHPRRHFRDDKRNIGRDSKHGLSEYALRDVASGAMFFRLGITRKVQLFF
jgi:hypothetical protein